MKEVPLTQGYVALVDDEDYERVMQYNWQANYHNDDKIYVTCGPQSDHPYRKLHHFILGIVEEVDHKDRNGLNNQKDNLRFATTKDNCANRRGWYNSESGYKGVTKTSSGRWQARLNGTYLSVWATPEEAARAYDKAAYALNKEFAFLNFPEELVYED
jgi:hypothetical protein